jgi:DNA repair exonuclease SbcCD ATPase subunit
MTNDVLFWTQVGSIVAFIIALFVLYRVLAEQKDATIQLLRETISTLKDQLAEARRVTPDVLAQTLAARVKLLEGELERVITDHSSSQEQIRAADEALQKAREKAEELAKQVRTAYELLEDYSCPKCGAALVTREHHSELVEYQGREIDVDHEFVEYQCGYSERDGKPEGECENAKPWPAAAPAKARG